MKDNWLASSRHIKELIIFSEDVIEKKSSSSNSIALVLVDNAVELLLREYQRFYLKKNTTQVENLSFKPLLENSNQLKTIKFNLVHFDFNHEMRNAVYHSGQLKPAKKDIRSAISYTKELFNELHPDHQFKKFSYTLPTRKSVSFLQKRSPDIFTSVYFATMFSEHYEKLGFEILIEPVINKTFRTDMVISKGSQRIILEFKNSPKSINHDQLTRFHQTYEIFKQNNPELTVSFWLITRGEFSDSFVQTSSKLGLTLIDDKNIKNFVPNKPHCSNCGKDSDLELDHIVSLSKGKSTRDNLVLLCRNCNVRKGTS